MPEPINDVARYMGEVGRQARSASRILARASSGSAVMQREVEYLCLLLRWAHLQQFPALGLPVTIQHHRQSVCHHIDKTADR